MATPDFDAFISYNSLDNQSVERIARGLETFGLKVFLDRWELVPGRPWPEALEEHLSRCRSTIVVLGPSGMGPWQQREHYLALDHQAKDKTFGVIPVLLPNADPVLGFLSLNTWVDLRNGVDDAQSIELLAKAIQGQPPKALLDRTRRTVAAICPYRGLQVFREEDAPFFCGRKGFIQKLRETVATQSLVAVVGSSGSGKSSVVRAGLIPSLRHTDAGTVWEVVTLVPGRQPLHALIDALLPLLEPEMSEMDQLVEVNKRAENLRKGELQLHQLIDRLIKKQSGTDRLLMVVDQWEELYTYAKDEEAKATSVCFINELLTAVDSVPITVVLTLRADFYGEVLSHRKLSDRLQAAQVNLGPMTRKELKQAITEPAQKVGLSFESGLVGRLLDDVGNEPGNLPLLEFALKELWSARQGNQLLHSVYESMDGVKGAIAQRAESVYETLLDSVQKKTAIRVFTRLVRPGDETGDTRLRAGMDEFDATGQILVRILAGPKARLLVTSRDIGTGQETVEVAHEALIREWGRLRDWVERHRSELQVRVRLRQMAKDWRRGKGQLVGGRQLRAFQRLRGGDAPPSQQSEKYLKACQRRAFRRNAVGSFSALVVMSGLGAFNLWIYEQEMSPVMGLYVLAGRSGWILQKPEIVEIYPGKGDFPQSFWMGSGNDDSDAEDVERPRHEVTLAKPFGIGRYEVTFEEYELFARLTDRNVPGDSGWGTGDRPVVNVSWHDAVAYADWWSKETGKSYRLPTEAEWEYAARAGTNSRWSFGDDQAALVEHAWFSDNSNDQTHLVGEKKPNPWGLYDMHGNVYEWVQDCWHADYMEAPMDGSAWLEANGVDCAQRVIRGGSWDVTPRNLHSAFRVNWFAHGRIDNQGFRLAQDL